MSDNELILDLAAVHQRRPSRKRTRLVLDDDAGEPTSDHHHHYHHHHHNSSDSNGSNRSDNDDDDDDDDEFFNNIYAKRPMQQTSHGFMSLLHQYTPVETPTSCTESVTQDIHSTSDRESMVDTSVYDASSQDPAVMKRRKMAERQRRFRQNNPTVKVDMTTMQDIKRMAEHHGRLPIRDAIKLAMQTLKHDHAEWFAGESGPESIINTGVTLDSSDSLGSDNDL